MQEEEEELRKRLQKAEAFSLPSTSGDDGDTLAAHSTQGSDAPLQVVHDELKRLQSHSSLRQAQAGSSGTERSWMDTYGSDAARAAASQQRTHASQSARALCTVLELLEEKTQSNSDLQARLDECQRCVPALVYLLNSKDRAAVIPHVGAVQPDKHGGAGQRVGDPVPVVGYAVWCGV